MASSMARRDVRYEVGPVLTLVNAKDFDILWDERRQLMEAQIYGADAVVISRADLVNSDVSDRIRQKLEPIATGSMITLSCVAGSGLDEVLDVIDPDIRVHDTESGSSRSSEKVGTGCGRM